MFREYSLLALIPARSGSQGLPGKNIMNFGGKPLIEWSILGAKNANYIDDVLVSTDSLNIADIAKDAGANVPFLRPDDLSTADASMIDVVKHVWKSYFALDGKNFDYVVLLQPTSPLRDSSHIVSAIEYYFDNIKSEEDTLVSVRKVDQKYGWLMESDLNNSYINFCFDSDLKNPQRQKLKPLFLPNGAIYIIKGSEIDAGIYHNHTIPFLMDNEISHDIDTLEDFKRAENSFNRLKKIS
jgi:CMP-N,N'-diacetyllegionaminic acid synthase